MILRNFYLSFFFTILFCFNVQAANQVCLKKDCVEVELAKTGIERMRGLQERPSLDANKGMLFIFPESKPYGFWMKDTKMPLDILWLDKDRKVVHIVKEAPPCLQKPCPSFVPKQKALYVLEVNAQTVDRLNWKIGDVFDIHLDTEEPK